jgi:hypothetical protein
VERKERLGVWRRLGKTPRGYFWAARADGVERQARAGLAAVALDLEPAHTAVQALPDRRRRLRPGKGAEADWQLIRWKPANLKRSAWLAVSQQRKWQGQGRLIVREGGGNPVPAVFQSGSQASAFIRARIPKGAVVHADEAGSWDNLHERFEVKRINHQAAHSFEGVCANWAEEYFSRLRRAEVGIHHHIAGAYLLRNARESSWRDNRRIPNGDQVSRIAAPCNDAEPKDQRVVDRHT